MSSSYLDISGSGKIELKSSPAMQISDEMLDIVRKAREEVEENYVLPETTSNHKDRAGKV